MEDTTELDKVYDEYGPGFKEIFPFTAEDYETAQQCAGNYAVDYLCGGLKKKLLVFLEEKSYGNLVEIILNMQEPLSAFTQSSLAFRKQVEEVLGDTCIRREMAKFSEFVSDYGQGLPDLQSDDGKRVAKFSKFMFWQSSQYDDTARKNLDICLQREEFQQIKLPDLQRHTTGVVISDFLMWLASTKHCEMPLRTLIKIFRDINISQVNSGLCATTFQVALRYVFNQLDYYLEHIVAQFRISELLNKMPLISETLHSDSTEPAERFILLARFAAVLGYVPQPNFLEFCTELGCESYFRIDPSSGLLCIVFEKCNSTEYNWPLRLLDLKDATEIRLGIAVAEYVCEQMSKSWLRDRFQLLIEESKLSFSGERDPTFTETQGKEETTPVEKVETKLEEPLQTRESVLDVQFTDTTPPEAEAVSEIDSKLTQMSFNITETANWDDCGWDDTSIAE